MPKPCPSQTFPLDYQAVTSNSPCSKLHIITLLQSSSVVNATIADSPQAQNLGVILRRSIVPIPRELMSPFVSLREFLVAVFTSAFCCWHFSQPAGPCEDSSSGHQAEFFHPTSFCIHGLQFLCFKHNILAYTVTFPCPSIFKHSKANKKYLLIESPLSPFIPF